MSQPIQRDGVWWHQKADGTWLRWNAPKSEWETAPAPPPPPPPAPSQEGGNSGGVVMPGPDKTAHEPAFGFSTAESTEPSSSVPTEGTEEVPWEFGEESGEPLSWGPANADVLPPESDKPTTSEWLNSNRAIAALVAMVVLAAAVFAAFTFMGGNADSSGNEPPSVIGEPLSKKAAVRKLNSLCKSAKRDIKSLGAPTTPDEIVDYMTGVGRTYTSFIRDVEAIQPGPEVKVKFARLVRDFRQQSNYADDMLAAAKAGNIAGAQQKLQALDAESIKMNARARAFGAHSCAST